MVKNVDFLKFKMQPKMRCFVLTNSPQAKDIEFSIKED